MIAKAEGESPYVLLNGVPWDVYVRFVDVLGEFHLRHVYDRGRFELRKEILSVPWETYESMLKALGDFHLRHFYDRGYLRLMSPLKSHDWVKRLISRFIESMALDQHLPIQSVGSTTITSPSAERGFEADEAYFIANELKVRGKMEYEPDKDPPPDLILEIDVTSSSLGQLELYGAMKVPEVWLHDGKGLQFLVRNRKGKYLPKEHSLAFPFLVPQDIEKFLRQHATIDETSLTRKFVTWARRCRNSWHQQDRTESASTKKSKGRKK